MDNKKRRNGPSEHRRRAAPQSKDVELMLSSDAGDSASIDGCSLDRPPSQKNHVTLASAAWRKILILFRTHADEVKSIFIGLVEINRRGAGSGDIRVPFVLVGEGLAKLGLSLEPKELEAWFHSCCEEKQHEGLFSLNEFMIAMYEHLATNAAASETEQHQRESTSFRCSGPGPNRVGSKQRANTPNKPPSQDTPFQAQVLVQWEKVEYICTEDDEEIVVSVLRVDPIEGGQAFAKLRTEVTYETVNLNMNPESYTSQKGVVIFEAGEVKKDLTIKFRNNPRWNVEALFDIKLSFEDSEHETAAFLGDPAKCRVVVLNTEQFPQNVEDIGDIPCVVKGFFVHITSSFPNETKWGLIWKFCGGLSFIMNAQATLLLYGAISESLLRESKDVTPADRLLIIYFGLSFFFIYLFDCFTAFQFSKLKLGGKTRKHLRSAVMNVVTQLSPHEQEAFSPGRVVKLIDSHIDQALVGYFEAFPLVASLFKLFCQIGYVFYLGGEQMVAGTSSTVIFFFVLQPFVMLAIETAFQLSHMREAFKLECDAIEAGDAFESLVVELNFLRSLVTTYRKGFEVTELFEALHSNFNAAAFEAANLSLKASLASSMVPKISEAAVAGVLGNAVVGGKLDFATFIVFLNTIRSFGPTLSAVFSSTRKMGKSYVSIKEVAVLLNSETRRVMLWQSNKRRQALIEKYQQGTASVAPNKPKKLVVDAITLHEVMIHFKADDKNVVSRALPTMSCVIEANQLVVLKGGSSVGKSVLLRLIGRHFIPTRGFVAYPDNWRVRYLDSVAGFFAGVDSGSATDSVNNIGTIDSNLHFGEHEFTHPDEDVFALLQSLGVSEELIGRNLHDFSSAEVPCKYRLIGVNAERLSSTNRTLLHLARALLSSVDLLLISNTLDALPLSLSIKVLSVLRELATTKGLACLKAENATKPKYLRKSKLVIFATKVKALEELGDGWMALGDQ